MSEEKKETTGNTVTEEVVNTVKKTTETIVETVADVKEAIAVPATTKKATWWNRICSAIVGAILAVGAMFGITTDKVAEEKAKVETIQTQAKEALEAIKAGDITTAQTKLTEATTVVKEVINDAKETIDNVKEAVKTADKKEVGKTAIQGAVEAITKNNVKNAENSAKLYTDDTLKK